MKLNWFISMYTYIYIYGMTFGRWQKDYIYGIELGGRTTNTENVTKLEIDKNNKGMTLVIQPRV